MLAAIAYVLAWIVGLSSGAPSLALNATSVQIASAFAGHQAALAFQFGFVEGIAGLMLAVTVIAIAATARQAGATQAARLLQAAGLAAAALSIVMWGLAYWLIYSVAPSGDGDRILHTFNAINRIDGPKMWLLGAMAWSSVGLVTHGVIPRWLKYVGIVLAIAAVISGIAYGLLLNSLAWTAYVSGILLLVWVCSLGITARADTP